MSFRDAVSLESQKKYSDSPEFDDFASDLSNDLYELNNKISSLMNLVGTFEKKRDIVSIDTMSNKINPLIKKINNEFKQSHDKVKVIGEFDDMELSPSQQFTKNRLINEVSKSLSLFNSYQTKFGELTRQANENQRVLIEEESNRHVEDNQLQQNIQIEYEPVNAEELEYQQHLIFEREQEIQDIQNGVEELNDIFQDLSNLVTDQGLMVDNIESNIFNISANTRVAADELTKALRYQRRSTGRMCCCLVILMVLCSVILLAIIAG